MQVSRQDTDNYTRIKYPKFEIKMLIELRQRDEVSHCVYSVDSRYIEEWVKVLELEILVVVRRMFIVEPYGAHSMVCFVR